MADLSLELLDMGRDPQYEDDTVQPYEVPQSVFAGTPDARGDGTRSVTQNNTDTIIYDVSMYS